MRRCSRTSPCRAKHADGGSHDADPRAGPRPIIERMRLPRSHALTAAALTGVLLAGCGCRTGAPGPRRPLVPAPPRRPARSTAGRPPPRRSLGFRAKRLATLAPGGQAAGQHLLRRRPQGTPGRRVELGHRTDHAAGGVLGDEVGHQRAGRHRGPRRRPRAGRPGLPLRARLARHRLSGRHRARPARERQRTLLVARSPTTCTLGQAADRTTYAVGLGQQHPRGTAWAYNNAAIQVLDRVLAEGHRHAHRRTSPPTVSSGRWA